MKFDTPKLTFRLSILYYYMELGKKSGLNLVIKWGKLEKNIFPPFPKMPTTFLIILYKKKFFVNFLFLDHNRLMNLTILLEKKINWTSHMHPKNILLVEIYNWIVNQLINYFGISFGSFHGQILFFKNYFKKINIKDGQTSHLKVFFL